MFLIKDILNKKYIKYLFLVFLFIFVVYNLFFSSAYYIVSVLIFTLVYFYFFRNKIINLNIWLIFFSFLAISIVYIPNPFFLFFKFISIFILIYYFNDINLIPKITLSDFISSLLIFLFLILLFYVQFNQNDVSSSTINSVGNLINLKNPYAIPENNVINQQHFMYPPGMLILYLPLIYLFGNIGYFLTNILLCALLILLIYKLVYGFFKNKSAARLSVIITLFLPLFLYELFIVSTNDLGVLFLAILSVFLFSKGKYLFSSIVLSLAVVTKIYPIIIFPIFLILLWKKKLYLQIFYSILILLFILALFCYPFYSWNSHEFIHDMTYQMHRPVDNWEKVLSFQYLFLNSFSFIVYALSLILFYLLFWFFIKFNSIWSIMLSLIFVFLFFSKTIHSNYFLFLTSFLIIFLFNKISSKKINYIKNNTYN